jgi:hypothetical protein
MNNSVLILGIAQLVQQLTHGVKFKMTGIVWLNGAFVIDSPVKQIKFANQPGIGSQFGIPSGRNSRVDDHLSLDRVLNGPTS